MSAFFIVLAYLLGSIPFGYLITRFSTGRDILEIGWRKTSGSNVFRNVGKWQGLITGILDVGKGALAVFLAQRAGFSVQVQALCGVAAVSGHNWSIFLKFAGGRGIGTFIGALLALSPKILGFSLIPLLFLALIWNAAIGTILFLITALILAVYFGELEIAWFFVALSFLPILIKRLSPVKELSFKKKDLMRNRLIFDNDRPCLDLRIKRIMQKLTER